MNKVTAQIAVEAIINTPEAFDIADVRIVRADAVALGVSEFYIDQLPEFATSGEWWNQ